MCSSNPKTQLKKRIMIFVQTYLSFINSLRAFKIESRAYFIHLSKKKKNEVLYIIYTRVYRIFHEVIVYRSLEAPPPELLKSILTPLSLRMKGRLVLILSQEITGALLLQPRLRKFTES